MFEIPKTRILERSANLYFENIFTERASKTHIALLSRAQNSSIWRHNIKSKVRAACVSRKTIKLELNIFNLKSYISLKHHKRLNLKSAILTLWR